MPPWNSQPSLITDFKGKGIEHRKPPGKISRLKFIDLFCTHLLLILGIHGRDPIKHTFPVCVSNRGLHGIRKPVLFIPLSEENTEFTLGETYLGS
jgi:hypothetical protein